MVNYYRKTKIGCTKFPYTNLPYTDILPYAKIPMIGIISNWQNKKKQKKNPKILKLRKYSNWQNIY